MRLRACKWPSAYNCGEFNYAAILLLGKSKCCCDLLIDLMLPHVLLKLCLNSNWIDTFGELVKIESSPIEMMKRLYQKFPTYVTFFFVVSRFRLLLFWSFVFLSEWVIFPWISWMRQLTMKNNFICWRVHYFIFLNITLGVWSSPGYIFGRQSECLGNYPIHVLYWSTVDLAYSSRKGAATGLLNLSL